MDKVIHFQTSSITVRCGRPMRRWYDESTHAEGWDGGTASASITRVTCRDCLTPKGQPLNISGDRQPVWLRRQAENKAKDMTGYIRPEGPDAA